MKTEIPITSTKKYNVKQELLAVIKSDLGRSNNKLPGERQLASKFGVSRFTISSAIEELVKDGLLVRTHGSGTYIRPDLSEKIIISVPVLQPEKIITRHLLGKLLEHAYAFPQKVEIKQITDIPFHHLDFHKQVIRLFSMPEPAGFIAVNVSDIPFLADTGFCEDLTPAFSSWPSARNLYQVAINSVTHKNRIYALPFHCSLGALQYHQTVFQQMGLDVQTMVQSLDNFLRGIEKFAKLESYKYSLFCTPLRYLLMNLLRAFYHDISSRFSWDNHVPIERHIGREILEIVHRLKWKLRAFLPTANEQKELSVAGIWCSFFDAYAQKLVPMGITSFIAYPHSLASEDMTSDTGFVPLGFGLGDEEFSLFNSFVWIINSRQPRENREFLWRFVKDYVNPQTDYELDRAYLESGIVHERNNCFIRIPSRVPENPTYDNTRRRFFTIAEPEIPYLSPMFEPLILAAERILLDRDIDPDQEYEFYLNLANRENLKIKNVV